VNHFDLDQAPDILVKVGHEKVHIEKIIELPTFSDHRVAEDVT
jgi:hypothetical protein